MLVGGKKCCWFIAFIPDESLEMLITSSSPLPLYHPTSSVRISAKTCQATHPFTEFWGFGSCRLTHHSNCSLHLREKKPQSQWSMVNREHQLLPVHSTTQLCKKVVESVPRHREEKISPALQGGLVFQQQFHCPNYARVDNSPHAGQ